MSKRATVYVRLLDEGVPVLRPVPAVVLSPGSCRLEPTEDYDPNDETWEFPPGTTVRCETITHDGDSVLLAVAAMSP